RSPDGKVELPVRAAAPAGTEVLVGVRPRDLSLTAPGHELTGSVYVTEVLGRSVEVTVRLGGQHASLVAPRGDTAGLRPDDPVRLTVRPENLLLFEADGPEGPGRRIGKR
ncbi:TOBE domain-containing protein, partial [Streptomyces sp. MBT33]|uniref:TOBE domain-containing protein n=1 Tax=Streptomyces sp. MBT33 TaxID=1488363 RepID=UPI00190A0C64